MTPTTLPIARLRAVGCKVSTIIGHSPEIGDFKYSIRVPDFLGLDLRDEPYPGIDFGHASIRVPRRSDGKHIVVQACAYRIGLVTPKDVAEQYRRDVAEALSAVAEAMEKDLEEA